MPQNPAKNAAKPIEFRTRRGHRVFRAVYRYRGAKDYAENYTFRIKRAGKHYSFNVGPEKRRAGELADEIAAFLFVREHTIEEAVKRYSQSPRLSRVKPEVLATVADLCRAYVTAAQHLSPATLRDNVQCLRRIAGFIAGASNMRRKPKVGRLKQWREVVDNVPLDRITPEKLEAFRQSVIREAGRDELRRARAITSSNTYLRCAGSMFAEKWRIALGGWEPVGGNPFRAVKPLPEAPHRYQSTIDPEGLLRSAMEELSVADPSAYIVVLLALVCGMRRGEIDRLIWDQVDLVHRHIWIRTTPYFRPKAKNSESRIDAPQLVFEALANFRALSVTPPFVIPGNENIHQEVRCMPVFHRVVRWLRGKGVSQTNALHTLRKEAGSLIYHDSGSVDLAADFLRNDPRVAREHYIGRKGRLEVRIPGVA